MKHLEKHISKFLAFFALFLIFGNVATASSKLSYKIQGSNQVVSTFQEDSQENPLQFHQISIGDASQTISQNENFGFGFFGMFYSRTEYPKINVPSTFNSTYSLKDKRELIFQYLFPFHFFW